MSDPEYLDINIPAGESFEHSVKKGHTVFAFVLDGAGFFDNKSGDAVGEGNTVLYGDGDSVEMQSGKGGLRFLLISGNPIWEPVAWRGPIVLNTDEELMTAFEEYRAGTFIIKG